MHRAATNAHATNRHAPGHCGREPGAEELLSPSGIRPARINSLRCVTPLQPFALHTFLKPTAHRRARACMSAFFLG